MKNNEKLKNFEAKQQLIAKRKAQGPRDNKIAILAGAGALLVALIGQAAYFGFGPGYVPAEESAAPEVTSEPNSSEVPDAALAENRIWNASLNLNTEAVSLELDGVNAPQAVANFVALAQSGFYENVSCHRLTTAGIYVLQCGDPDGTGAGGPGYNFGPIENAPADDIYAEGTLAMARVGGDGSSMGSQFFIVYDDSQIPSDSAGGYTVFGKVTGGLEAIKAIAALGTSDGSGDGSPLEAVLMNSISVE
ncbi:MAG: peptidylprolyl isomerase [Aquiluna sp.]|nr:peptidylprolyl isomerase [Aquiluna sp.]MCF8545097.1 peptidylprolyl isomerase [Aquiluna sp.]